MWYGINWIGPTYRWGHGIPSDWEEKMAGFVYSEDQAKVFKDMRRALIRGLRKRWRDAGSYPPRCEFLSKTPVTWMRRPGERYGAAPAPEDSGDNRIRRQIVGIPETLQLLRDFGFDVEEVWMGKTTFAELSAKLACPRILMGIEGATFVNALLLINGGGTLQINLFKHIGKHFKTGNTIVASGFHSTFLQYLPEIADTQYHSIGSMLQPAHMLAVVNELDRRIRHQRRLQKQNRSYTFRQYYGPPDFWDSNSSAYSCTPRPLVANHPQ